MNDSSESYFASDYKDLNKQISDLVQSHYGALQFEQLGRYFDGFAESAPENYMILDQSAEIHFVLKNYEKAQARITQSKQCDSSRAGIYALNVALYVELGNIDTADAELYSGLKVLNLKLENLYAQKAHIFGVRILMLTYLRCAQGERQLAKRLYDYLVKRFNIPKEEKLALAKYI